MRVLNNNPLTLEAASGERLALSSDTPETKAVLSVDSPGGRGILSPATKHRFVVPEPTAATSRCFASVVCTFKTPAHVVIELSDESGVVAPHTFNGTLGLDFDIVTYNIAITPTSGGID